jgi:hypothetical protein
MVRAYRAVPKRAPVRTYLGEEARGGALEVTENKSLRSLGSASSTHGWFDQALAYWLHAPAIRPYGATDEAFRRRCGQVQGTPHPQPSQGRIGRV